MDNVIEIEVSNSQRRHPRIDVQHNVSVRVTDQAFNVTGTHLSFGGAFLKTEMRFTLGALMPLSLTDGDTIAETQAKVIHQDTTGIAVAFYQPTDDFLQLLSAVLYQQILANVRHGVPEDEIPARIALLSEQRSGYHVLFTSSLNPNGAVVLVEDATVFGEILQLTLCERGLFDDTAQVMWGKFQQKSGMRHSRPLEFTSKENHCLSPKKS